MESEETNTGAQSKNDGPGDAKPWADKIKSAQKAFANYTERCDNIAKQYANLEKLAKAEGSREMQLFWANVEVLKPTIYARQPQPVVAPRFNNRKPVVRAASELVERALHTSFDLEDVHGTLKHVRDDLALFGRGVPWIRYKTEGNPVQPDPNTEQEAEDEQAEAGPEEVEGFEEYNCYDHVNRKDFLHEPARTWKEVGWVARRSWLTREQGMKRFPDTWTEIKYVEAENDTDEEYRVDKKAPVWEVWDRDSEKVIWIHPDCQHKLDEQDPWLDLESFFPCPEPAFGTKEPDSLIPVPDMLFYKDQLEEVNELTERISSLSESLRLKGFYSGGAEDVSDAIETALKNTDDTAILIPVPQVAALGAGLKDAIVWMPIREVAEVIAALVQLRKQLIEDIYQISGISDIMRGETKATETATAQNIKAQYGSVRVKERQNEMIRVADCLMRMSGEIMSENFQPETLMSMGQVDRILPMAQIQQHQQAMQQFQAMQQQMQAAQQSGQPVPPMPEMQPPPPLPRDAVPMEEVFSLLRNERMRPYVLKTASDSTIQPDEDAEKQRRNEFATAVGGLFAQAGPVVQTFPQAAPLFADMLKFVTSAYRAGREMEATIDDFTEKMTELASQPQKEGPSPEEIKAQAEEKRMQMQAQIDGQKAQAAAQVRAMDAQVKQLDAQNRTRELQMKSEMDARQMAHDMAMAQMDERLKGMDIVIKELAVEAARAKPKANGDGRRADA